MLNATIIRAMHHGTYDKSEIQLIAVMMEAVITSETSVNFYHTTWHSIPEDGRIEINFIGIGRDA
jgi:hypothetical protein